MMIKWSFQKLNNVKKTKEKLDYLKNKLQVHASVSIHFMVIKRANNLGDYLRFAPYCVSNYSASSWLCYE